MKNVDGKSGQKNKLQMKKKKWFFIDVENVLLNEDQMISSIYELMWNKASEIGKTITFPRLLAMREALIREKKGGMPFDVLGKRLLTKNVWEKLRIEIKKKLLVNYKESVQNLKIIISELKIIKSELKINIALVARQPRDYNNIFKTMRIKSLYSYYKLSEKEWLTYPLVESFIAILNKVKANAENVILLTTVAGQYVNDISEYGTKIILFKPKIQSKNWSPGSDNPFGRAYLDSLERSDYLEKNEEKKLKNVSAIISDEKKLSYIVKVLLE